MLPRRVADQGDASPEVERRSLERWPDARHASYDGRHNPFSQWRFLEPGDASVPVGADVAVILPSLAALLGSMERRGRPLTEDEVEQLVEEAPAILLAPEQAMAMERARGYADIEPGRAWAQWQILRAVP